MPPIAARAESGVLASVCVKRLKHFGEGTLLSGCSVLKEIKKCKKGTFKLSEQQETVDLC